VPVLASRLPRTPPKTALVFNRQGVVAASVCACPSRTMKRVWACSSTSNWIKGRAALRIANRPIDDGLSARATPRTVISRASFGNTWAEMCKADPAVNTSSPAAASSVGPAKSSGTAAACPALD